MRKVIAGFAVSLDGYMEGPNGEYDWMLEKPAPEFDFVTSAQNFDTFLIGRKTYEKLISFGEPPFKGYKNYVFSRTLQSTAPGYALISENVEEMIKTLKIQSGKDIAIYGGADLLASLLNLKVVDEISMTLVPILLGAGKPLVGMLNDREWLDLKDVKTYSNGNIQLTYNVLSASSTS